MSGYNVTIGSTSTNVTVGYRPTLGVTQQASGIVGPAGPAVGSTTSINTTGIITASYFVGDGSLLTNIGYALTAGIATNVIGGIASVTQLNVSGITTVGFITATNLYVAGVGTFLSSGLKIRNPANTFGYTITGGAIAADYTLTLPVVTSNTGIAVTGLAQTFTALQTHSAGLTVSSGNLTVSGGTITAGNVTTGILGGNTTTSITFAGGQTSGNLIIGNTTPTTGTITLGRATTSQQTDIQAGVSGVGTTKTINLGTGGGSGSFTNINIGPTAGVGTVVINSGTNLLVGSATSTGTASQRLQVTGGGYVSGNLGVGNTNPSYNIDVTGSVGITTTSGDALLLSSTLSNGRTSIVLNTNGNDWELGSRGSSASPINSFYIYDRNASAYRQVIDPSGNVLLGGATATTGTASQPLQVSGGAYVSGSVGIGTTNPTQTLDVRGNLRVTGTIQNASMIAFSVAFS